MATFLLVWELGGGLGHVMRLKPIGEQLRKLGHHVIFAVQNLQSSQLLVDNGFECLQAPVGRPLSNSSPNSMAGILSNRGYCDADILLKQVKRWRLLYKKLKPDLILIDYAPTAILAARDGNIRTVTVGNGFWHPPRNRWACNLRPWLASDGLIALEKELIQNVNQVAKNQGLLNISRIADLFYGDKTYIYDLPETDTYKRKDNRYFLNIPEPNNLLNPTWKNTKKIKVAGYIKKSCKDYKRILSTLSAMDVEVIMVIPGFEKEDYPISENIVVYSVAIDLSSLITGADVVIFHAGTTIMECLLKGKVLLLAPLQLEQFHSARRAQINGFGEIIDFKKTDLTGQFEDVISNQQYFDNVEKLRKKYSSSSKWLPSDLFATQLVEFSSSKK